MRKLLSGYVLLAAWLIVLGLLAGVATYGLLQPAPPPSAEPVSIAMPEPAPEPVFGPPAPLPAPDPDQDTAAASPADDAAEPVAPAETAPDAVPEPAPDGSAVAQAPAEAEAADDQAPPETPEAAEAPETPAPPEAAGEPAAPSQTAESGDSASAPLPEPAPPAVVPDAEEAAVPAPDDGAATAVAVPAEGASVPAPDGQQVVQVPLVPPAPEELPYWERFRQPFNTADPRPRIAVVLTGLGLSDSATQAAIDNLPAAITLSFSPYARGLERWIALARSRGHEVMLDLPMEPTSFPNEDPGPQGLLTGLSAEDNLDRLDWVLSRGSAYVGVAGAMGSRFTASRPQMETILKELKSRGLIFLDNRTTDQSVAAVVAAEIGLQNAFNNRSIDERQASRLAIDARLAQIERIALSEGFAVAMAQPYPVTLDRLVEWSTELTARGYAIAPISALVNRQERR